MDGLADRTDLGELTVAPQPEGPQAIVSTHPQCARAVRVAIRGVVQGVGFRPFVYRLAHQYHILGWVRNTSWGVEMEVEGGAEALTRFVVGLREYAPPLAHIESLAVEDIPLNDRQHFQILHSEPQAGAYQLISPDIATCADCLREVLDSKDRRYRYPFTNCTNCGPRFTIIAGVPYDRPRTTMREFRMCPDCQREYDDPLDRRFHAQPNACPVCGPHLTLRDAQGRPLAERDEALRRVVELLRTGHIVAIKGLGGYQLACDATRAEAVSRLRERKRRPHKPFAVMVADVEATEEQAILSPAARDLLTSPAAPIVLLPWREGSTIVPVVAPATQVIGIMLPYTPLHHVLLRDVQLPLIMTSGNLTEEPIARDNDEALRRLRGIADYFLTHNRGIYSRYDDSVWFIPAGGAQPVRRARGYAPFPIHLPFDTHPILACGAELKNTFCLTRDQYAFLSQHIGDMQNLETLDHYKETIALYRQLFHIKPETIACDMHPDYRATRYGLSQPGTKIMVQHHHAHLVSCLADRGVEGPAIGVILDGTGYGLDGHIWGGEFLVGDARGFQRAAYLQYLPLPGGDQAVRKPYRLALAYLRALLGENTPLPQTLADIPEQERRIIKVMVQQKLNTPLTSSAGRLFDAVSALLGVCRETSYEAQAAIELEMSAHRDDRGPSFDNNLSPYPYDSILVEGVQYWGQVDSLLSHTREIRVAPLFEGILHGLASHVSVRRIAWRFHLTVAQIIVDTCEYLRTQTGLGCVALSGGCFQNRLLLSLALPRLQESGFDVLTHRQVPCNDGGIALGQAVVAHYQVKGD